MGFALEEPRLLPRGLAQRHHLVRGRVRVRNRVRVRPRPEASPG